MWSGSARCCAVLLGVWTALMPVAAHTSSDSSATLSCLSFNLLHGGVSSGLWGDGQDLERRLELVTERLRSLEPDIIGLQEASEGRGRGNVAQRLATQLGYEYVFSPASSRLVSRPWANRIVAGLMNFAEGPAILSRYPILELAGVRPAPLRQLDRSAGAAMRRGANAVGKAPGLLDPYLAQGVPGRRGG